MKAAVINQLGSPFTIEDRPVPTPSAEQVLVRIEASGLCHTDTHVVGDRVAIAWLGHACGRCPYCVDGAFAECAVVAEGRTIDQVNACVAELLAGDVPARLVFEF